MGKPGDWGGSTPVFEEVGGETLKLAVLGGRRVNPSFGGVGCEVGGCEVRRKWGLLVEGARFLWGVMAWGIPNFEGGGEAAMFKGGTNFGMDSWAGILCVWTDVGGALNWGAWVGGCPSLGGKLGAGPLNWGGDHVLGDSKCWCLQLGEPQL